MDLPLTRGEAHQTEWDDQTPGLLHLRPGARNGESAWKREKRMWLVASRADATETIPTFWQTWIEIGGVNNSSPFCCHCLASYYFCATKHVCWSCGKCEHIDPSSQNGLVFNQVDGHISNLHDTWFSTSSIFLYILVLQNHSTRPYWLQSCSTVQWVLLVV